MRRGLVQQPMTSRVSGLKVSRSLAVTGSGCSQCAPCMRQQQQQEEERRAAAGNSGGGDGRRTRRRRLLALHAAQTRAGGVQQQRKARLAAGARGGREERRRLHVVMLALCPLLCPAFLSAFPRIPLTIFPRKRSTPVACSLLSFLSRLALAALSPANLACECHQWTRFSRARRSKTLANFDPPSRSTFCRPPTTSILPG